MKTTMYAKVRYKAGISQETMAYELGVSRRTVQNWESGQSMPDLNLSNQWFKVCGINPTPYYLGFLYENINSLSPSCSEEAIEAAFRTITESLTHMQKRAILYFLYGSHGSDVNAFIQLTLAYLHLPMKDRASIASSIITSYKINDRLGSLLEIDHILPDINLLETAYFEGRTAAMNNNNSYVINKAQD